MVVVDDEGKEDTIYCEWCGEFPYHIAIYEETGSEEETLICEKCYNELNDE